MSSKQLARELGILRKRRTCDLGPYDSSKRSRNSIQVYDYLIVIDFESTCWKDEKHRTQEIIEFPAVLLNTESGEVENEFQHYVQPQENPLLSDFCKQLTGITQESVDDGIPLYLCLRRFTYWLTDLSKKKNIIYNVTSVKEDEKTCTFVTWSDWDLAVCLQYECRRKQLRKPQELNSWIDLRATYRQFYGRRPQGLNGALHEIGVTFEGREHSGLHDARNTARLAWHMIKDGCVMQITKTLTTTTTGPRALLVPLNTAVNQMSVPRTTPSKASTDVRGVPNTQSKKRIHLDSKRTSPSMKCVPQTCSNKSPSPGIKLIHETRLTDEQISMNTEFVKHKNTALSATNMNVVDKLPALFKPLSPVTKNDTSEKLLNGRLKFPVKKSVSLIQATRKLPSLFNKPVEEKQLKDEQSSSVALASLKHIGASTQPPIILLPVRYKEVDKSSKLATTTSFQSDAINAPTNVSSRLANANVKKEVKNERLSVDGGSKTELTPVDVEKSSALINLCGINMDDWFEDDFHDGEFAVVSEPSYTATDHSKTPRLPAAKTPFRSSDSDAREVSSNMTDVKKFSSNGPLRNITNTISKLSNVPFTTNIKRCTSSGTMPVINSSSQCSSGLGIIRAPQQSSISLHVKPFGSVNTRFKPPGAIAGELQTPVASRLSTFQGFATPSSWQTPNSVPSMNNSGRTLMKKTPPLCDCGCRSKRKFVQNPGPNLGRSFYCCGSSSVSKTNCKFFKWEVSVLNSPASFSSVNSLVKTVTPSSSGTCMSFGSSTRFVVTPVSIRPRFISVTRLLVPPN